MNPLPKSGLYEEIILFPAEDTSRTQISNPTKMYMCTECNAACDSLETLQFHLQQHPGATIFMVTAEGNAIPNITESSLVQLPSETQVAVKQQEAVKEQQLEEEEFSDTMIKVCSEAEKSEEEILDRDLKIEPGKLKMFIKAKTWEESYIYNEEEMTSLQSREFELQLMTPEGERQYSCTEVDKKFQSLGEIMVTLHTNHSVRHFLCIRSKEAPQPPEPQPPDPQPAEPVTFSEVLVKLDGDTDDVTGKPLLPESTSALKKAAQVLLGCPNCQAEFSVKESLNAHMKVCTSSGNGYEMNGEEEPSDMDESSDHQENTTMYTCQLYNEALPKPQRTYRKRKKTYQCDECSETFPSLLALKGHKNKKKGIRPYVCNVCERAFFRPDILHKHARIHSYKPANKCEECGKEFFLKKLLEEHMKQHRGKACPHCNVRMSSSREMQEHLMVHERDGMILCRTCGIEFSDKNEREKHEETHQTSGGSKKNQDCKSLFLCKGCGILFSTREDLLVHIETHKGEKPFLCDQCGRGFTRSDSWKDHCRTHTTRVPLICEECGKHFVTKKTLRRHMQIWHSDKVTKTRKTQKTNENLDEHGVSEAGENKDVPKTVAKPSSKRTTKKDFVPCSFCGKMYEQGARLMRHERTHTTEGHYMCKKCGKQFKYKYNLWRHEAKHKEGAEKAKTQNVSMDNSKPPYFCSICDKTYLILRSFKGHMQTHEQEAQAKTEGNHPEPVVCDECGKVFTSQQSLEEHMSKHLEEKGLFKCHLCESKFQYEHQFKRHLGTHMKRTFTEMVSNSEVSKEVKHVCLKCYMMFESAEELKEHSLSHVTEGKFKCDVCDRKFKYETHLLQHCRTHAKEDKKSSSSNLCAVCGKNLKTKKGLERHMKKHSSEESHDD